MRCFALPCVNVTGSASGYSCTNHDCEWTVYIGGEKISLMFDYNSTITDGVAVPITQGIILFFGTQSTPVRVSCIGSGSSFTRSGSGLNTVSSVHLSNISDPKSCPGAPVSGSLGIGIPAQ